MRSSSTALDPLGITTTATPVAATTFTTNATTTSNESLKTAYEGDILDESDIEHLFQIFVETNRKDGRLRRFDISGSNLVGDGSYYIADCILTYRDYEYDQINLGYTLLQLKGKFTSPAMDANRRHCSLICTCHIIITSTMPRSGGDGLLSNGGEDGRPLHHPSLQPTRGGWCDSVQAAV